MGPATAPITIVEFSDFECPFCQRVQPNLKPIRDQYGDRIRWVYKHYPLDFHSKAKPAAYAAMAAHQQGKFWEFSKELWAKQNYLSDELYQQIAKSLKLDMVKFKADSGNATLRKNVATDMADGVKVGVQGTPFFLINGKPLSGAQPTEAFVELIEAELTAKGK
jgi:protein-disulfide isomerase